MCAQCDEIDAKVARYRRLASGITDQRMIDHLTAFMADLMTEKNALHPGTEK